RVPRPQVGAGTLERAHGPRRAGDGARAGPAPRHRRQPRASRHVPSVRRRRHREAAVMTDNDLDRLLDVYRAETAENLTDMEQSLLAMESRGAAEPELMHALLRAAHTVKGNSAMVAYDDVVD